MKKKISRIGSRTITLAVLMLVSLLMPELASAKWTKASSKFVCNGVEVEVVDRRNQIGKSHSNTYGYVNFLNRSGEEVTVDWKCYGVLKEGGKLVLLNEGPSFTLAKGERRGQTYSYGAGKFNHKDFEKYVASVEVTKGNTLMDAPVEGVSANNADKVYQQLERKMNSGDFSQEDYSKAIDWLRFTFDDKLMSAYNGALDHAWDESGNTSERLMSGVKSLAQQWAKLADFVTNADEHGRLNTANHAKFKKLQSHVEKAVG